MPYVAIKFEFTTIRSSMSEPRLWQASCIGVHVAILLMKILQH
jgi:hypothetical protein